MALAGLLQGVKVTVIMPSDAPAMKVAATRGYGAEVVFYDRFKEDREALGRQLAGEGGLTLIPPYDHPDVIAGQGTAALELIEEVGSLGLNPDDPAIGREGAGSDGRPREEPAAPARGQQQV